MKTLALIGTGFGMSYDQRKMVKLLYDYIAPEITIVNGLAKRDFDFLEVPFAVNDQDIMSSELSIICPKVAKRLKSGRDDKFWNIVDRLRQSDKKLVIVWPMNSILTYQNVDDVAEFLSKRIVTVKPWIDKLRAKLEAADVVEGDVTPFNKVDKRSPI